MQHFMATKARYEELNAEQKLLKGGPLQGTLHKMYLKEMYVEGLTLIPRHTEVWVQTRSQAIFEDEWQRALEKDANTIREPEDAVIISINRIMYPQFVVPIDYLEECDVPYETFVTDTD